MEGKSNLVLVESNNPYDMKGVQWGSEQFIKKAEWAELQQEEHEMHYRMEQALDVMRSI